MQGVPEGRRPVTAVLTEAERQKFDRSVFGFLVATPASGNRPAGQSIDYDAMAKSWNADVELEEMQVRKGHVVVSGHNLVNRKNPGDLRHHLADSKNAINAKRTMAPHKAQLAALRKAQRVTLLPFTSAAGASICELPSGDQLIFPVAADAASARPRPRPVMASPPAPVAGNGAQGGNAPGVNDAGRGGGSSSGTLVLPGGGGDGGGSAGTSVPGAARDVPMGQPFVGGRSAVGVVGTSTGPGVARAASVSQVTVAGGNPCFVMPFPGCSTFRGPLPSFGVLPGLLQPWNPQLPVAPLPKPARAPRNGPCCQVCGHFYTTGTYAAAMYHIRLGGSTNVW